MKEITAYQTSDGTLFNDEKKAKAHQDDIIGEALDTLVPDIGGNITRVDRHRILMAMLGDKELKSKVGAIYYALTFDEHED